jgi:hypothetical protein
VIGGCTSTSLEKTTLKKCLCVDANMAVYDRESMSVARFNTPLALVRDRFIIACGGQISEDKATD